MPTLRLPTSHDIVQLVRRWSRERQIGHTGTLDPLASGVLVLCLGHATRLVEYYQGHAKQYVAEIVLGNATDTYDALGAVTATASVPLLTIDRIEAALHPFRGSILQAPPAYSAIKQGGESLHRKARRGETVTLVPRPVTFYQIKLIDFVAPDRIHLHVYCSAGAYIRSLAHDLGVALQTFAHLAALRRTAAGPFTLENAHPLDIIEAAAQQNFLPRLLLAPGYGLDLPRVVLDVAQIRRFGQGQKVPLPATSISTELAESLIAGAAPLVSAWDASGHCVGILRWLGASAAPQTGTVWKAEKWFAATPDEVGNATPLATPDS